MNRSLPGGAFRQESRSFAGWLIRTWLPVVIMLVAIAIESTHTFSSDNTSGWMRAVYQAVAGRVTDAQWVGIHHHIRKTGHFSGYGLMGLSWMRAWLILWRQPLLLRSRRMWRGVSFAMAIFCTMLVASLDELHQSFMPDRTGLVSDVLLDTGGAVVLTGVFFLFHSLRTRDSC